MNKDKKNLDSISDKIKSIKASETMFYASKANELREAGVDIIDFSIGEPDFPTPLKIKKAAISAIENNLTRYTLNAGLTELRLAIKTKLKRENDLFYETSEIIVSNGAKQCIFNAVQTIINEGDEVIIPAPYWASYPEIVKTAGGIPVILETNESKGFKVSAEDLIKKITGRTKLFILCNPSNPTGTVYTKTELEKLAEVISKYSLFVIADEIYEKIVYDNFRFTSFASIDKSIKNQTILINGVSKAYAMTGWRIGYAAGPEFIINEMDKLQSHSTSGAGTILQYAAIEALNGSAEIIEQMRIEFEKRRNFLYESLTKINGISCHKSEGTFYLFPNFSSYFGKSFKTLRVNNSYDLAMYLIYEANCVVVPGNVFGTDGYLRISFAASLDTINEFVERVHIALEKLK